MKRRYLWNEEMFTAEESLDIRSKEELYSIDNKEENEDIAMN